MDDEGRPVKWALEATGFKCSETGVEHHCVVTASSMRKYRTRDEEQRSRMARLDKQAEADNAYAGAGNEDFARKSRRKREMKLRCKLFSEWADKFAADVTPKVLNPVFVCNNALVTSN